MRQQQSWPLIPVHTGAQIRAAEAPLLDAGHGPALMRRASYGLAQQVLALLRARGRIYGAPVTALVGSGNNGGDALFALATLRRRGVAATAVLVGTRTHADGLRSLRDAGGRILDAGAGADSQERAPGTLSPPETVVLIDAVLGTGARGEFRLPQVPGLRETAGSPGCLTVACDVPSGIDADTGRALGEVLPADHTVTFGGLKQGLLTGDGALLAGEVHQVDIGLGGGLTAPAAWTLGEAAPTTPAPGRSQWREASGSGMSGLPPDGGARFVRRAADPVPTVSAGALDELSAAGHERPLASSPFPLSMPRPTPRDHKYSRGVLHVVAGSEQYPGAAQLTVGAAVAVGSGMVTLGAAESVCRRLAGALPEVVASSEGSQRSLRRASAAVVGPGIGTEELQVQAMSEVLEWAAAEHPVVLDASALDQLHGQHLAEHGLSPNLLLTPHQGELRRLIEHAGRQDLLEVLEDDAVTAVRGIAEHLRATVLLKGASTVIAAPGGSEGSSGLSPTAILRSCAPGLATAGTGDVLSGILGALAAAAPQRPLWQTAALGVRLHTEAAQRIDPQAEGRFGASALLDALQA